MGTIWRQWIEYSNYPQICGLLSFVKYTCNIYLPSVLSNEFLYPGSLMSIAHLKSFVDGGDHSFLNNLTGCFDFRLLTTPRASCILDCYNKFFTKMWVNSTQCEETQDKAAHRMCAPCCSFVWNSKYFVRVNWMLHICVAAMAVCIPVVNLLSLLDDLKRQYHTVKCRFLWSPYWM